MMLDLLWPAVRPALFRLDAEVAHELTLALMSSAPRLWAELLQTALPPVRRTYRDVGGVRFGGPVGLAAGLDKDGRAIPIWAALGFGAIEVGTVTAHAQPGNPQPRLFRLPNDRALINRMGFNNHGSLALAARMRHLREAGRWPKVPVGANIGKSKVTPLDAATEDYVTSAKRLTGLADWLTVNVSSPNTPGLRDLQGEAFLSELLPAVVDAAGDTPVFLKLAPDLDPQAVSAAVGVARAAGVRAVLATNTTIRRDHLGEDPGQAGGLSGPPLWRVARPVIEAALEARGDLPIIGIGGVASPEHVTELLNLGCAAVQLYTALIYEGPGLPARLHRACAAASSPPVHA